LVGGVYRIGRDASAEIRFTTPAVSKQHALLERRRRCWVLRDLNSTNGLWWRGRRVQELLLVPGDRVMLAPGEEAGAWLQFENGTPRPLRWLGRGVCGALAAAAAGGLAVLGLALVQVPIRGDLASVRGPLVLYDRLNRPMRAAESSQHQENRNLEGYPPVLVQALLSSEDSRFWWHPGVDPIGTGRALVANLQGGRVLERGSTITQQLARSLYPEQVGQGETLARKWRELLVALQLEARFSKRDLLLSYLNRVYLGVGWGFEDAARHYFGRPARDLRLEEAALLVGLLPSPNGYDPCIDPQAALESRNRVLLKMVDNGRLSSEAARRARRQPIALGSRACAPSGWNGTRPAPFYTDQVRRDLERLLGSDVAAEGNFLLSTHFDPLLQEVVERRLRQLLQRHDPAIRQGAVVVLDARNGGILAISGGRDYSRSQYNRASMALRQPGSTFKLFPYLVALEKGMGPNDPVPCGPLEWGGQVFRSGCGGELSLRQAFASSSNTAALRLARLFGLEAVVEKARALGLQTPLEPVPGLVLGQAEVRLVDLTAAYAAVANGGIWHPPSTIRQLSDSSGGRGSPAAAAAPQRSLRPGRRVLSTPTARKMQELLQAVVRNGTGRAARLGGQEGGKTGTTNGGRDLLFIGYEPSRHWVMGIWLGNDDNRPTGASSAVAAALWADILQAAGRGSLAAGTRLR
ncbi:MAG: transglycosylase domain-containing protein, partial [Vulcanococcus sp.]